MIHKHIVDKRTSVRNDRCFLLPKNRKEGIGWLAESKNFFFVNKTRMDVEKPLKHCKYWL